MARKLASNTDRERQAQLSEAEKEQTQAEDVDTYKRCGSSVNHDVDRRSYLRLGGAALVGSAVAGSSAITTAGAAANREGINFGNVVNAVDDLGLDPTGSDPVNTTLNDISSGTLVQFPEGEYLFVDRVVTSGKTLGFESIGDERATIVVDEGYNDWLLGGHGSPGLYVKGFNVDQTAPETNGCFRLIGDHVHIEDIEFIGRADIWETGAENMLNCAIEDPDGYGEIRNVVHRKGHWARYGPGAAGRIGIYTGRRHVGTLKIVDCDLREFGNNALYCSRNTGKVQVEDCYFENNNASAIRIGGEGSYAENCTVVTDPSTYNGPRTYEDSSFTHRAIVIEERFETGDIQKPPGAEIRNCHIRIEDNPANGGAIHRYGNGRSLRIENTVIEYNNNGYPAAIMAQTGGFGKNPDADPPKQIEFVNSVLHGSGDVDTAISIDDSDDSLIEDSIIYMYDGSQDGVTINDSDNCLIRDSTISVPGRATVFNNSNVVTENIDHDEPDDLKPDPPDELEHQLRIIADDDADAFEYTFTVDGEVELVTDGDYPANPGGEEIIDNGDGTFTVEGIVAGYEGDDKRWGGDTFRFEGEVTAFEKHGPATLYLDGEEVEIEDLVGDDDDDGDENDGTAHQLRIIADEDADAFEYTFTVDGEVELVTDGDYPANPDGEEIIDNGDGTFTVEGIVAGYSGDDKRWGGDTFKFTGELLEFSKEGPATVLLDGEVIDPDEYVMAEDRFLDIFAKLHADTVEYKLRVDGEVEHISTGSLLEPTEDDAADEMTVTKNDDGTKTVSGTLAGGERTRYRIAGSIKSLRVNGPASVTLDDEEVIPSEYGLHDQLTIVGLGTLASFDFTVDGELEADPNGPRGADGDISGSSAEGVLTDGLVSFRFDGEIVDFNLDGHAGVYLNGRQVDPNLLVGDDDPFLSNWLVVHGDGDLTEYQVIVTGTIHKAPDLGPVEVDDEIVDDNHVTGTVVNESDGYRFTGSIEELWLLGTAEVQLDK